MLQLNKAGGNYVINFDRLNEALKQLKIDGKISLDIGTACPVAPITVKGYGEHALKRAVSRGIKEKHLITTAQAYVDNAMVMFEQGDKDRRLYISHDGNVVIMIDSGYVATIYTSDNFDPGMLMIIREVERCKF